MWGSKLKGGMFVKGWKHTSKPKKDKEEFVGVLRAELTEEARQFIRPMRVRKRDVKDDGLIFTYYEDGRITVTTKYDHLMRMVEDIKNFRAGKGRGF